MLEVYLDQVSGKQLIKETICMGGINSLCERYYLGNDLHREDGPAVTWYEDDKKASESYFLRNKLHRENGPSIIHYKDGTIGKERWYLNGRELDILEEMVIRGLKMEKLI